MKSLLSELNASLGGNDLEHQIRALIKVVLKSTGLESAYLTRIDLDNNIQQIVYATNEGALQLDEGLSVPWDDTLCKRALELEQYITNDVRTCWGDSGAAKQLGIRTYMSAPVSLSNAKIYGTVCAASTSPTDVSDESLTLLKLIGRIIGFQIEREQLVHKLKSENQEYKDIALIDPLTGLGNRRALEQELKRGLANAKRNDGKLFVAFIDLDDFKKINDDYGHDAGDRLLIQVSEKIKQKSRSGDFVARIGGDEFVVVGELSGVVTNETDNVIKNNLVAATSGRFDLSTAIVDYSGASVGVVISNSDDTEVTLLKAADQKMYQVKNARRVP